MSGVAAATGEGDRLPQEYAREKPPCCIRVPAVQSPAPVPTTAAPLGAGAQARHRRLPLRLDATPAAPAGPSWSSPTPATGTGEWPGLVAGLLCFSGQALSGWLKDGQLGIAILAILAHRHHPALALGCSHAHRDLQLMTDVVLSRGMPGCWPPPAGAPPVEVYFSNPDML